MGFLKFFNVTMESLLVKFIKEFFKVHKININISIYLLNILLSAIYHYDRYVDLVPKFGRTKETVIFNHMLSFVYDNFNHLLTSFNQLWLTPGYLSHYAERIQAKGTPLNKYRVL